MASLVVLGGALIVALAFWLRTARLVRKLYVATREDARRALGKPVDSKARPIISNP
jgi:hypothetical protein